ncbi:hypothetical protein F6B50_19650 [Salmonella enterica]|nr:hypothetical protein [Salmonella enterica]EDC7605717.1 hypothetical protein [Salmonella enterica subsp. enterica serovar Newport]EBK0028778.1 hypothetical protein [Salmonella enterica]ECX3817967.1 hypothetical protein [Salmonella enterica]ECY2497497.1 hypothetical protein [Salmonella enterica]
MCQERRKHSFCRHFAALRFRGRRHDPVREPDALEAHVRFDERGVETGFMVRTVRHRQSKEAATDMPDLTKLPRHISTLPVFQADPE